MAKPINPYVEGLKTLGALVVAGAALAGIALVFLYLK